MKPMTKAQLIKLLEFAADDDEVFIITQSGDYWRTEIAHPVREVSDGIVTWSEYHRTYQVPRPDDDHDEDEKHPNKYVILIRS